MKVTIKDVAKAAGVSPSTVSRALHHNPRISAEVSARIQRIAAEMDFHPNPMASSLVSRQSRIVGIVFPGDAGRSMGGHPFYPAVLQGLGHAASERHYHMLLSTGSEAAETADTIRQLVDSGYVSGLIVLAAEDNPEEETRLPVVVIGRAKNGAAIGSVDNDNVAAGRAATRYLLERGHRRILLLGCDERLMVTAERRRGYEQALEEAGIPFRAEWMISGSFLHQNFAADVLDGVFCGEQRPTAVVSMDDALAIGLMGFLGGMGLSVPGDVSVVSFNNTDAGRYHTPALTSIDVNPYRLGTEAMALMLDLIEGKAEAPVRLETPFTLIERGSVAIFPITQP
ncbi:MAG: LacI family DNA-binding transcriptional regulator [Clostridia bacterium]